jgi:AcrR family transcriptional regulator
MKSKYIFKNDNIVILSKRRASVTRHRSREERIVEILEAAAEELIAGGYSSLTMEAIARRTGLSRGGLYRFFANRREIALALFTKHYRELARFDVDEVIGWQLPITKTLSRLLFELWDEGQLERDQLVWVQLIAETPRDPEFNAERERLLGELREKFGELVKRLVEGLGFPWTDELKGKLDTAIRLGVALMEGLVIQGVAGASIEEQGALVERFVEVMLVDAIGKVDA